MWQAKGGTMKTQITMLFVIALLFASASASATPCGGPQWFPIANASPLTIGVGDSVRFIAVDMFSLTGPCLQTFENRTLERIVDFGDGQSAHELPAPLDFEEFHRYVTPGNYIASITQIGRGDWTTDFNCNVNTQVGCGVANWFTLPYTQSDSRSFNITVVPEPQTYAMLLAGLGLLRFMARRRKQNAA
jgi:hypothetical protein